jgi:SNF2 family DNA or RNA helicase
VVTQKAMLTQFQKEWWSRFSIPLVRLDSVGLARVRNRIPANHNPFNYFDRSIISIDTLKSNLEYRNYLENAWWDVIVIDECHNVAARAGESGLSRRARLAKLLATRSDTLMLLSATPHDGSARSFASLMSLLDPTAISDPDDYTPEDFRSKGLVIRRFKKDIKRPGIRRLPGAQDHLPAPAGLARWKKPPTAPCSTWPSRRAASTRPAGNRSCSASACRRALFSSPGSPGIDPESASKLLSTQSQPDQQTSERGELACKSWPRH